MKDALESGPSVTMVTPWIKRAIRKGAVQRGTVTFGAAADVCFVATIALAIPWLASVAIPLAVPLLPILDPGRYWLLQTVHQIAALVLTLVTIRLVSVRTWAGWGFNLNRAGLGIAMTVGFALAVSLPTYFLMSAAPQPTSSITAGAIVAVLITHLFVIGSTQEVLFRGFVMGFLENRWPTIYRLGPVEVPLSGLIAAVIFTLAHVKPFPPYAWPAQLAFSFIYGVIYAVMYRHTRSLLGPALAHGYSNAAYVAMMMLKYA